MDKKTQQKIHDNMRTCDYDSKTLSAIIEKNNYVN